ncbi:pyridoxamine 5'-phosphate oxidase family protein [Nonomuraea spiralis]|uniref:pyridoxamine 5'-phosphate oxidase family protein n=1 Tax=Nonomuraea TaxID=83681 RepID=UPI00163CBE4E|nr:pyridoxamine 5'-phosphate oxidase family protein [Nonomuraea sp. WAC 01424]
MGGMEAGAIRVMDREECLTLLSMVPVGRVAWARPDGTLVVLPVNFTLDADTVVFRIPPGPILEAIESGVPMAFEVDDMEPAMRTGWSVLLTGVGEVVRDPAETGRLERLTGAPWPELEDPVLVRLSLHRMAGRRLPLHPGGVVVERLHREP